MRINFEEINGEDSRKHFIQFNQYYKDYPVENSVFNVQTEDEIVRRMFGNVVAGLEIDVSDPISEVKALEIALEFINAEEYAWENEEYANGIIIESGNEEATWFPQGKLIIGQIEAELISSNYIFAWKFNVLTTAPFKSNTIYVNARSGEVVVSCRPPQIPDPVYSINYSKFNYQSSLSDEFDNSFLNTSIWQYDPFGGSGCFPVGEHPDFSIPQLSNLIFTQVPNNSGVTNIMRLRAKKEPVPINVQCPDWLCLCATARSFDYSTAEISSWKHRKKVKG